MFKLLVTVLLFATCGTIGTTYSFRVPDTRPDSLSVVDSEGEARLSKMVCYYTNWGQYRPGDGKYRPNNIKEAAHVCTHIHYAFATIRNDELAPYEWNDEDHDKHEGNYRLVTDLKKNHTNLKVLLTVGGWNMNSGPFSIMARTRQSRRKFILSARKLVKKYNFDGLDYDWEYPTQRSGSGPEDRHRFTLLLKETAQIFKAGSELDLKESSEDERDNSTLLVTAALGAGPEVINASYEWNEIHKYLDYAVVMSYDYHGSWDNETGENAPMYNGPDHPGFSVNASITRWLSLGFPASKLLMSVPSYGRSFTLRSADDWHLGAPVNGPGSAHAFTRAPGIASFYELCQMIQAGAKRHYLSFQQVPFLVLRNQWVGYDDQQSLTTKVSYAKDHNLAGIALWSLDMDDFSGKFCSLGAYPLLRAIVSA